MDLELLRQRLSTGAKMSTETVDEIVKRAKDKQYQLACREFFKGSHPTLSPEDAIAVNINHPNQFYELAQKVSNGISLSAIPATPSGEHVRAVKIPLNDSRLLNSTSASLMDDTSIDAELSKIDSTLMEYADMDF